MTRARTLSTILNGGQAISNAAAGSIALAVKGAVGQTESVFQAQTSAGGALVEISSAGQIINYGNQVGFTWAGDIDTAKWSSTLGGYYLTFGTDGNPTYSYGSWGVSGRTYKGVVRMASTGAFMTVYSTYLSTSGYGNLVFGSMSEVGGTGGCFHVTNASSVPTSNPSGGGVLYVQSGALKYRGSSGTTTTIANA